MKKFLKYLLVAVIFILGFTGEMAEVNAEEEKIVIALDPGHDVKHAGAAYGGLLEHQLTFKIANYCKDELSKHGNIEVYLTRTDYACPYPHVASSARCIEQRMLAAKARQADYYVSIHLNSQAGGTSANGVEVIYPNGNWNSFVGTEGKRLAENIQKELISLGLNDRGIYYRDSSINERYPDGSLSDYYTVHISGKENGIPSVIVEHAFITNTWDRNNFLMSDDGLRRLGIADARAILKTLGVKFGWKYEDGAWYYYSNDERLTGWIYDGGDWYYLQSDGVMLANGWAQDSIGMYYMGANGKPVKGWHYIEESWYYFQADGVMAVNSWVRDSVGWCYLGADGKLLKNDWAKDSIGWYYMGVDGRPLTGWQYIGENWYYFKTSGLVLTNSWAKDSIGRYYMGADGKMVTGWLYDKAWYFLQSDGLMLANGWAKDSVGSYYMGADGKPTVGWKMLQGLWYYFRADGMLLTNGWARDSVMRYYMGADGTILTNGWAKDSYGTYYIGADAKPVKGWKYIEENWYYFKADGVMLTNDWAKDSIGWYYMGIDGKPVTNWYLIGDTRYYFKADGVMLTNGWAKDSIGSYYMGADGKAITGWGYIENSWYYFMADGLMLTNGWTQDSIGWYYMDTNGRPVTGWKNIDGKDYLFDADGKKIDGAKALVIDVSKWQGTIDWDKVASTNVKGVIVRSSHGDDVTETNGNWKDSKFQENIAALNRLGMSYGIYHYNTATTVEQARVQAMNTVALIREAGANPTMPVFVDIEQDAGKCDLIAIAKVYMEVFTQNGYKPGIYANGNYWKNYLNDSELEKYFRWVAGYGDNSGNPSTSFKPVGGFGNYMMWQYTSQGVIDGITENTVDCNVLFEWYE